MKMNNNESLRHRDAAPAAAAIHEQYQQINFGLLRCARNDAATIAKHLTDVI
jgi:hypothetical protein